MQKIAKPEEQEQEQPSTNQTTLLQSTHQWSASDGTEGDGKSGRSGTLVTVLTVLGFIGVCGLIAYGALPRISQQKELVDETKKRIAEIPSVSATIAETGPKIQEFVLPGITDAVQDALIYARVNGYIHNKYVEIGNRVKAGQLLADIETPELDQQSLAAASSVEQAQANLDNFTQALSKARTDLISAQANTEKAVTDLKFYTVEVERYKGLASQGVVSQEDKDTRIQSFDSASANLRAVKAAEQSAEAMVNSAKAAVHVAQAALNAALAQHNQIEATRSFRKVKAPFDGVVTKRNADAGELVTLGSSTGTTALFEIAQIEVLKIVVAVPEQYVPFIHDGEKAQINVQEYPDQIFDGRVTHVAGGLDTASKTLQVEIYVQNANHKLLPGMYAQVHFQAPVEHRLVVLPATAVKTRADGCFVYTVDKTGIVQLHKITIGRDLGGQFEIVRGVKAGDKAIISPSDEVRDGIKVTTVLVPGMEKADSK